MSSSSGRTDDNVGGIGSVRMSSPTKVVGNDSIFTGLNTTSTLVGSACDFTLRRSRVEAFEHGTLHRGCLFPMTLRAER